MALKIVKEREVVEGVNYQRYFEWPDCRGAGYSFDCDEDGNVKDLERCRENYEACLSGAVDGKPIKDMGIVSYPFRYTNPAVAECEVCKTPTSTMDRYCGAYTCSECGNHHGLARCFCGWSLSGRDGRAELEEEGEVIEPDGDYEPYYEEY